MNRAIGQYQITNELTLSDFTFYVHSIHQDLTNSSTRIHVRFNTSNERYFTVQGILTPAQAIAEVKTWFNHEVITEQVPESIEVTQTTLTEKLLARRSFGNKVVNDFLTSRLENPTNLQEDIALSSLLMPIALTLQLGSLGLALAQISQLQPMAGLDMNFVNEKMSEIQTYLANEGN